MNLLKLIQSEQWKEIQNYWEALPALSKRISRKIYESTISPDSKTLKEDKFCWDKLRLILELKLNILYPLIEDNILTQDEFYIVKEILHKRFDQSLDNINLKRQEVHKHYMVTQDPYIRPKYNRYYALLDMEKKIKELKRDDSFKNIININICQRILDDSNMELMEILGKNINQNQINKWETLINLILALSCNEIIIKNSIENIINLTKDEDNFKLILQTLQESSYPKVLDAAIRLSRQNLNFEIIQILINLSEKQISYKLKIEIIKTLSSVKTPEVFNCLIKIVQDKTDDFNTVEGLYFYDVREQALIGLKEFEDNKNEIISILQGMVDNYDYSIISRLRAITTLAYFRIFMGFDTVIGSLKMSSTKEYIRSRNLALEAIIAIGDRRAIPFLIESLNICGRGKTVIERYGKAFDSEIRDSVEPLLKALKYFGVKVEQDEISGEWFEVH